jgi:pimeloyl-ACP methyl ester carboxylesterase
MIRRATGCTESHPPTLVIWGEKDNFVPRSHGETYAKLIPNCSELKIIPGAGHSAQVEKPEETAKSMMDFLAK